MREDEGEWDGQVLTRLAARMTRTVGLENLRCRQGQGDAVVGPVGHWSWRGYFANGAQEGGRAVRASEGTGTAYLISGGGDGGGRRRVRADEERRRCVGGFSEFELLSWASWRGGRVGA